jgi:DNA-binding GntR family transcriptional regulator
MASSVPRLRNAGPLPSNPMVVAEALREAIARGDMQAGDRIKEVPLAQQLGLSRGPIRDALRMLEVEGLIAIVPNRGAVVREVHASDVLEVYALRAALGSLALHKLMVESDLGDFRELKKALERLERAVTRNNDRQAAEADLAFQDAIVARADMPRVNREFTRLTWQVRMFIATLDTRYADKLETMLEEVRALYEAICSGTLERAEQIWRAKFERWVRHFIEQLPGEDFDAEMWLMLTAGPAAIATRSESSSRDGTAAHRAGRQTPNR